MNKVATLSALLLAIACGEGTPPQPVAEEYRVVADSIINAAIADSGVAWNRLARFVDYTGPRLSGSEALELGIDWMLAEFQKDGLDNARTEPVMVPHWVRGAESATLLSPRVADLPMLGLGGSIATPAGGITADVIVVSDFAELAARSAEVRGKIVLFDAPFTTYGETVVYRRTGAIEASKLGAVASLIRSVAPFGTRMPHTGVMSYDSTVAKIPHAAITIEDAMMLHRMQERGEKITVRLAMSARTLPDAPSRNVMAELRGSELPDEVIVMGGHIDSWDVGQGAMDDGGGIVVAWEAINLLKRLGLVPRRTIRIVGWTNEENGMAGARAYRDTHSAEADKHVLMVESDGGVFSPQGLGFTGSDSARAIMLQIGSLLERINAGNIGASGGGADIGPMMELGIPGVSLDVDESRYFWYHHTEADTMDKLDPAEMQRCVAVLAVLAYIVADLPAGLPR